MARKASGAADRFAARLSPRAQDVFGDHARCDASAREHGSGHPFPHGPLGLLDSVLQVDLTYTRRNEARCSAIRPADDKLLQVDTVYFRLNRDRKLSGVNPRTYSGISMLLTAFRLLEVHGDRRMNAEPPSSHS